MDFVFIENLRLQTAALLPQIEEREKFILLNNFYSNLLLTKDQTLIDSFTREFIFDYATAAENFSPEFNLPSETQKYISIINQLIDIRELSEFNNQLDHIKNLLESRLQTLEAFLQTQETTKQLKAALYFPLIGSISVANETIVYNAIEKIWAKVSQTKTSDRFVFVPSNYKKEKLATQAKVSFELAKEFIKQYKKGLSNYHEVLIYFENLSADYDGDSIGISLTLAFIEQLSLLYNLPYLVKTKGNLLSTGGLDSSGKTKSLGKEIVSKKMEAAFYSEFDVFILPKQEEANAHAKLIELQEKYPARKLRIVAVESLEDLLERRSIIEYKKQPAIIRTSRFAKTNWIATLLFFLLTVILSFAYVREFDDNPAVLYNDSGFLFVKNIKGKVLWSKKLFPQYVLVNDSKYFHYMQLLCDVNNDGVNEVVVAGESPKTLDRPEDVGRIVCFDNKGEEIWKYTFQDTVVSEREILKSPYSSLLLDTATVNNKKILLAYASNRDSFSSAIYCLELKTGKRILGTLWNSGHITEGFISTLNNSHSKKIVFSFCNNGLDKVGIGVINLDEVTKTKVLPTTKNYLIQNYPIANTLAYILFPNTDYNIHLKQRHAGIPLGNLYNRQEEKFIQADVAQNFEVEPIFFKLNYNLKDIEIIIYDRFRTPRDLLVKQGILNPPYSDTPEYKEILINQIVYWNGKTFVSYNEYKEKEFSHK